MKWWKTGLFWGFFLWTATLNFPILANAVNVFCTPVSGGVGVSTALGCVPAEMGQFVTWLLPYLFGIVGGISFLLMAYGFIQMTMSQGDPKVVQGARETITSAIEGLLFSIFALFILRLITVGILKIPGF